MAPQGMQRAFIPCPWQVRLPALQVPPKPPKPPQHGWPLEPHIPLPQLPLLQALFMPPQLIMLRMHVVLPKPTLQQPPFMQTPPSQHC